MLFLGLGMPTISSFYGILIRMYFNEHEPAHFHALYGDDQATVDIEKLSVLEGKLPRRAMELVLDWAELHQAELRELAFGKGEIVPSEDSATELGGMGG